MGSFGEQFAIGDQSDNRKEFWRNGFRVCPKCKKSNIKEDVDCAGCRHNGDGYGTTVFTCSDCNWVSSFQYDEASSPYYYETRFWVVDGSEGSTSSSASSSQMSCLRFLTGSTSRAREVYVRPFDEEAARKFNQLFKLGAPIEAVRQMMVTNSYSPEVIDTFMKGLEK